MSVSIYRQEQLAGIAGDLCAHRRCGNGLGLHVHVPEHRRAFDKRGTAPEQEEEESFICWALSAAWIAQHAAAFMTYGADKGTMPERGQQFGLEPTLRINPTRPYELAETLGNIRYNCVSNGGTSFLPEDADDFLLMAERSLFRMAAQAHNP